MSNLAVIQPQRVDFDTQQTCDWLDALPVIGVASAGGVVPGAANAGNGLLSVVSVAPGTPLGAYVATVTQIGALTRYTVADTAGMPLAQGVAGAPLYAGGLTFTLAQGAVPFAVGDTFAAAVLPAPVDLTGIRFDLDSRLAIGSGTYALQASTADAVPTIVNGNATGTVAMRVPRATMAKRPPGVFPYSILASDPITGLTVPAFYGQIHHVAIAAQLGA